MKTRLDLNSRRRRRPKLLGAILVILVCLLLVIFGPKLLSPFGRAGALVATPIIKVGDYLYGGAAYLTSGLRFKRSILAQNLKLSERVMELEAQMLNYRELLAENQALREEVSIRTENPEIKVVPVISYPWNSPFDVILVGLSRGQDVNPGDQVTLKKNSWVGEVTEVLGTTAKIRLLSAPGVSFPVLIGEESVPGLALGKGGGNLSVSLPRSLEIKIGDSVRAASSSALLMVGTVGSVEKDPSESLQTILVQTPIDLSFVRFLEINAR